MKEGVGEQEGIESLADTTCTKESRWWEEGDDSIKKSLWELAPYSAVHPWSSGIAATAGC